MLHVPRAEEGRGLISVAECIGQAKNSSQNYILHSDEKLIEAAGNGELVTRDLETPKDFKQRRKVYEDIPKSVVENDRIKILWDVSIQCDHVIEDRRPDIVIINKEDENCFIVDIAITKGKVTLFYVGSPFSYQTGINGNPLFPLPPPQPLLSVLRFTDI